MNFADMMSKFAPNLGQIKEKVDKLKEEFEKEEFTGSAGSDFVKVTINGRFEIISIEYDNNNNLIKDDINLFVDLIKMAHNDAVLKARSDLSEKMSNYSQLGIEL